MSLPDRLDAAIRRPCGCFCDPVIFGHDLADHYRPAALPAPPQFVVTVQWQPPLWPFQTRSSNA